MVNSHGKMSTWLFITLTMIMVISLFKQLTQRIRIMRDEKVKRENRKDKLGKLSFLNKGKVSREKCYKRLRLVTMENWSFNNKSESVISERERGRG